MIFFRSILLSAFLLLLPLHGKAAEERGEDEMKGWVANFSRVVAAECTEEQIGEAYLRLERGTGKEEDLLMVAAHGEGYSHQFHVVASKIWEESRSPDAIALVVSILSKSDGADFAEELFPSLAEEKRETLEDMLMGDKSGLNVFFEGLVAATE